MLAPKIISANYDPIARKVQSLVTNYLVLVFPNIDSISQSLNLEVFSNELFEEVIQDFHALRKRDPASENIDSFFIDASKSFLAVMYYRVANKLCSCKFLDEHLRKSVAKIISEDAKIATGIEIHPAAKIGKRFVIDHGYGTVIGETCEIGDDCYILESVILGARRIASNPSGKRHPTLKNNVEIGGFVRVLGAVTIGNNVFIAPHSVITSDIPDNSKVAIINQLQVIMDGNKNENAILHAVTYMSDATLCIHGENIPKDVIVKILQHDNSILSIVDVERTFASSDLLKVRIVPNKKFTKLSCEFFCADKIHKNFKLAIEGSATSIIILNCKAVSKALLSILTAIRNSH
jgi:serine O-acetyltransferase